MGIERTLKIGKTHIEVFLDKNLHLFDKDMPGTRSLTNAMSNDYVKEVMAWIGDYRFDRVFLYHTDGIVTEWVNNNFRFVDSSESDLFYWFVEQMAMRQQTFKMVH